MQMVLPVALFGLRQLPVRAGTCALDKSARQLVTLHHANRGQSS